MTVATAKRVDYPHGDSGTDQLSVTSLLHAFPIPLVVFKRFQNILFGLLGCNVLGEIRFQLLGMEADLFFLIGFPIVFCIIAISFEKHNKQRAKIVWCGDLPPNSYLSMRLLYHKTESK